jgi:hypothetical protein
MSWKKQVSNGTELLLIPQSPSQLRVSALRKGDLYHSLHMNDCVAMKQGNQEVPLKRPSAELEILGQLLV